MKEVILSLVRHTLTTLGGVLVTKGLITSGQSADLVGLLSGILLIIGATLWGSIAKVLHSKAPVLDPVLELVSQALAATPAPASKVEDKPVS